MLAIVDYGVGNIYSLSSAVKALGAEHFLAKTPEELAGADSVILPGVGAFSDAADKLRDTGMWQTLIDMARAGNEEMAKKYTDMADAAEAKLPKA